MATPRVRAVLPAGGVWASVEGAAANVAGITWQNVGDNQIDISPTPSAPTGSDPFIELMPGNAFYDQNGSAKMWARAMGGQGGTLVAFSD